MRVLACLVAGSLLLAATAATAADVIYEPSVELGVSYANMTVRYGGSAIPASRPGYDLGAHLGAGIHRLNGDWRYGMRLQFDQVHEFDMLSLRVLDVEYQVTPTWAAGFFAGARRLDTGIPAYGYLVGAGVRGRDLVMPNVDVVWDVSYGDKIARDKLLPGDPPVNEQAEIFYDIFGTQLYLSWRF